ncbi:MAG TPA: hypothetical protein VKB27_20565 [Gammaproteobacteria bacterium]|nr:hypothetical protein [Gammaproteobacteria bacterium]
MKLIIGFFGLLYDLVIGDCWQIAAETAAILLAGIGLLRIGAIPVADFSVALGAAIMLAAALVIYLEGRISHARKTLRAAGDSDRHA